MDQNEVDRAQDSRERLRSAIRQTAPGTSLRHALDMIIAGHMGALICIGDTDAVLAAGDDGFKLDISFTANRLFELSKMDGAIVIDKGLTQILRANYHLNPDPSLPTSETGMRHRTAARMSLLTKAIVISVSERRQVVNVFVDGKGHQLRTVTQIMASVNQLLVSLQSTRTQLDRSLLRLTTLELDNYATLSDITETIYLFEVLATVAEQLDRLILELGSEGKTIEMQRDEFVGDASENYTLLVRDYAADSSRENVARIRIPSRASLAAQKVAFEEEQARYRAALAAQNEAAEDEAAVPAETAAEGEGSFEADEAAVVTEDIEELGIAQPSDLADDAAADATTEAPEGASEVLAEPVFSLDYSIWGIEYTDGTVVEFDSRIH